MARTLIGQLILRLRAEGLGEANKVRQALDGVEAAARRMGSSGVRSWGIGFQKQIAALKLSAGDLRDVEQSWIRLHEGIKSRNLKGALKGAEISHWKTNTLAELAQMRGDWDRHYAALETKTRGHAKRMEGIMKPLFVSLGFYTAAYGGGLMIRGGVTASAERRREHFRQEMANIPEADREKLADKAEELGTKYPSLPITAIMEMARSAYSTMGNADRAAGVLERMAQALVVLQSTEGPDAAIQHLTGLIRGFDNLGVNKDGQKGVDLVNELIDAAVRAAQVDPDFDPGKFFPFAQRTKVAGPALSPEFLARSSVYMQDMGADATGNMIAMAFKAFVLEAVGSAGGKRYLAERDRIGVRKDGKLVDAEMFGANPDQWVLKYLVPALQKDGVDMDNETAVAAAVGKLSGNTNATAFMTRIITQRQQIERWLQMMANAAGTDVAEDARFKDPFVAFEALKSSLANLSAALLPIDTITAGLNALADGINKLAAIGEDNPFMTAAGIGLAGFGMYKGGKWVGGKLADMFGLGTAAAELTVAARMLQSAAAAQGGADVLTPDGKNPDKPNKPTGKMGLLGYLGSLIGGAALVGAGVGGSAQVLGDTPGDTFEDQVANQAAFRADLQRWIATVSDLLARLKPEGAAPGAGVSDTGPGQPLVGLGAPTSAYDPAAIDEAKRKAAEAGRQMEESLSPTAKPHVDSSSIDSALSKAQQLRALLRDLNGAGNSLDYTIGPEMRRNMSD